MMSTITTATTPPMMATVLSELEAELAGSEGVNAVCVGGDILFPGPTGAEIFMDRDQYNHDTPVNRSTFICL